jgi:hypothetical protein
MKSAVEYGMFRFLGMRNRSEFDGILLSNSLENGKMFYDVNHSEIQSLQIRKKTVRTRSIFSRNRWIPAQSGVGSDLSWRGSQVGSYHLGKLNHS